MNVLTRCPHCATVFRAGEGQLNARQGWVRCGRCGEAFNALGAQPAARTADPAKPPAAITDDWAVGRSGSRAGDFSAPAEPTFAPIPPIEEGPGTRSETPITRSETLVTRSETLGGPRSIQRPPESMTVAPELALDEGRALHRAKRHAEAVALGDPRLSGKPYTPEELESYRARRRRKHAEEKVAQGRIARLPERVDVPGRKLSRGTAFWAAGSGLLLALLAAQAAHAFRAELVSAYPPFQEWAEKACAALGCVITATPGSDALRIESSALEAEPDDPRRVGLSASIGNHSGRTQPYPWLALTLKGADGQPLARRLLGPDDYLTVKTGRGIGAGEEAPVTLAFELQGAAPAGYQLELFYP